MSMLTGGPISAIPAVGDAQRAVVVDDREAKGKARNDGVQVGAFAELPTPAQPLPLVAEGMTPDDLFRIMREVCQKLQESTAGVSDAAIESKKGLIEIQAEKKVEELRERQSKIDEMLAEQEKQELYSKLGIAAAVIIAAAIGFFSCGTGTPAAMTLLVTVGSGAAAGFCAWGATQANDWVAELIPNASEEEKRTWGMVLSITLTIISALIPFNPVAAAKSVVAGVRTAVQVGVRAIQSAVKFMASAGIKGLTAAGSKMMAGVLARLATMFKSMMGAVVKAATKAAARVVDIVKAMANTIKGLAKAAQQAMRNLGKFLNEMKTMISKLARAIKAGRFTDVLNFLKGLGRQAGQKLKTLGDGIKQGFNEFQKNLKNMLRNDEVGALARQSLGRSAQKLGTVTQGGLGMAQAYGEYRMAEIEQEMIEDKAKHKKLEAVFEQCLEMLDKELPRLTKMVESCASFKEAERDFARSQTNLARA